MKASDPDVSVVAEMVFPSQSNHYGTLFGGEALKLMAKAAFVAASRAAHKDVVMKTVDDAVFHLPVSQGDLAEVLARVTGRGDTSLTVEVELFSENLHSGERRLCCSAHFVMVAPAS